MRNKSPERHPAGSGKLFKRSQLRIRCHRARDRYRVPGGAGRRVDKRFQRAKTVLTPAGRGQHRRPSALLATWKWPFKILERTFALAIQHVPAKARALGEGLG